MANYKVSYKVLSQQGTELKAIAKLVDGYADRVNKIRGKLGDDNMLAEIRQNLQKLSAQLGESRAILNMAGEVLTKSVASYTNVEAKQVKAVDNVAAHKRDFYKNPVVVASAGAAAAAAPVNAAAAPPTVNYTETNTVNYTESTVVMAAGPEAAPVSAAGFVPMSAPAAAAPQAASVGSVVGVAAGAGVAGGALGAGAVMGVMHLKKERDADKAEERSRSSAISEDSPEAQLQRALEEVRRLENEG